ncbi:MAG: response regulator [Thermoanaerobaculia bacterium]
MPTVLVVDDDPRAAAAVAALAAAQGFETRTAETLAAARKELEERPDVLLCDLVLPDGRGTDLLEELADDPSTVTVFITGNASTDSAVAALRAAPVTTSRNRST